jgi:DDE family transposase
MYSSHRIARVTCLRLSSRWISAQSGSAWRRWPCLVPTAARRAASSAMSVNSAGNGQPNPALASRFKVNRTVDGATPTRRAISLSPIPAVLKRSTSRTRRIAILSAGIRSPMAKAKGADPNRASRGAAYPGEIIPEWRAKSSWNAERDQIGCWATSSQIRGRLPPESAVWDATTFTKNRDRLLEGEVAAKFLTAVLSQDKIKQLLSSGHFSVDGTLPEAWASPKSFRPKDGSGELPGPGRNGERDFHGERRKNDTHLSTTDGDARLFRKGPGKEARLCFMGHALMENRSGLIVNAVATRASGHAERLAALALTEPHADRPQPVTLGADKGYDTKDFVIELRDKAVTPHVAQNQSGRCSAIDGRTTRSPHPLAKPPTCHDDDGRAFGATCSNWRPLGRAVGKDDRARRPARI